MKKIEGKRIYICYKVMCIVVLVSISVLLLTSCKVTEKIQGKWYVEDGSGATSEIRFSEDKVTVDGMEYSLKQTAVGTENGIKYYGIEQNGESYSVLFPEKKIQI